MVETLNLKSLKMVLLKVQLQGSCSGCPSSTMTLKQGVQNLLCHYLPEVKEVVEALIECKKEKIRYF